MSELGESLLSQQLEGLEPVAPDYDYVGLSLPSGLIINAVFGSHDDIGEVNALRSTLSSHDIIVQESPDWDERYLKDMRKVVRGDYRTLERWLVDLQLKSGEKLKPTQDVEWDKAILHTLYNVNKPVLMVDVPKGHPIAIEFNQVVKNLLRHGGLIYGSRNFADAINAAREQTSEFAAVNKKRENYMLRSFCDQMTATLSTDPKLKDKLESGEGVAVYMLDFGFMHVGLYEGIQEVARRCGAAIDGSVKFGSPEFMSASYDAQIEARHLRGLEVDDILLAKKIIGHLLAIRMLKQGIARTQAESIAIAQIDNMGMDELEVTYEKFKP